MSIEQTTQLIQLILNSVLMVVACAFVLSGLLLRRGVLENRLQMASVEYFQILNRAEDPNSQRLLILKQQLRRLQQQVKSSHSSILGIYYALLSFVASTFLLSMRTVVEATWLISTAMGLFIVGIVILLFSVALALLVLYQSDRPFWQELWEILSLRKLGIADLKGQSFNSTRRTMVRTVRRANVS